MTISDLSLALVRFQGDALASARGWINPTSEERRRRAIVAAQQLDHELLWSLTEAHTSFYGSVGAGLSPEPPVLTGKALANFCSTLSEPASASFDRNETLEPSISGHSKSQV
ncbi:hypothetical protein E7T06_05470 [Deinococcus sp. Arct2-2]|uniref:hypothetical protein n=1 Tax=Deinococcus sp. Arct2-2 TaxID=2568653 RepID=UPI0010A55A94|nr:hypothetical protein [Deinococcus sp. Arct2-2]THF70801.1 hypothetical protein E7T06_05470 [Deinococcus sp. Arct2-2]